MIFLMMLCLKIRNFDYLNKKICFEDGFKIAIKCKLKP